MHYILDRKPTEAEVHAEKAREREDEQRRGMQVPSHMYEGELVDDMQPAIEPMPTRRTKREILDARLQPLLEQDMRKRQG